MHCMQSTSFNAFTIRTVARCSHWRAISLKAFGRLVVCLQDIQMRTRINHCHTEFHGNRKMHWVRSNCFPLKRFYLLQSILIIICSLYAQDRHSKELRRQSAKKKLSASHSFFIRINDACILVCACVCVYLCNGIWFTSKSSNYVVYGKNESFPLIATRIHYE